MAVFAVVCTAAGAAPAPKPAPTPVALDDRITIVVNGQALARRPAPQIVNGRILLPVVRVYASLGLAVRRNGSELSLSGPGKQVVLHDGSARALVDDVPVMMDGAAQTIGGTTYVPLRFVADSLGAQVTYNARSSRVEIVSSLIGRNPTLERRGNGGTQLVGTISAIDANSSPPSLTVERGGTVRTIAVTSDAQVALQDVGAGTSTGATVADLHVGDAVSVFVRGDGHVSSVIARYTSRSGKIAAASSSLFVLDDGFMVSLDKTTQVTLNSQPASLGDLQVGDSVTVRLNPDTNEKRQVIAARAVAAAAQASPGPVTISSLTVNGKAALRAGDAFEVTMRGTPGGRATYDIGHYVTNVPMTESASGTYSARYVVPPGVNFGQTSIYGRLTVGGDSAPRAEASGLIAVSTTPPQIVEVAPTNGQTINNSRPSIFATFRSPTDVGINAASASIAVNGQDVTGVSTRTDGFITYSPAAPLADGPVQVVVRVSDRAGNAQVRTWSFTIRAR
jgi:hypothetical protein